MLVLFSWGAVLSAQEVHIDSHQQAFEIALERNLDLENYRLNERHAQLEYKQAKNYRLPTISGTFTGQKNLDLATTPLPAEIFGGEPGTIINTQFGQEYTYNAGISITKDLFSRQEKLKMKMAQLNVDRSQLEQQLFEELLYEQVFLYYHTALIAEKAIEIGKLDLESARQINELTDEKHEQGLLDAAAVINTSINRNKVEQGLNANRQLKEQCHIELKKLLGLKPTESLVINQQLDYQLPKPLMVKELEADKSLAMMAFEADQAEMQLDLNKAALLPTVSMSTYHGSQQFRDNFGLGLSSDDWTPYSFVTLNLNVPIFSGFKNKQKIKQSKISLEISQNDKLQLEQETVHQDEFLVSNYNNSLKDARLSQQTFELYQQSLELSDQKYTEGLVSLDKHLSVFEDYLKAENAYLNSLSVLYSHYSQIEHRL